MVNYKCGNCHIVYDYNPNECEKCGSTVLRPSTDDADRFKDEDSVVDSELDEEIIKGRHIIDDNNEIDFDKVDELADEVKEKVESENLNHKETVAVMNRLRKYLIEQPYQKDTR